LVDIFGKRGIETFFKNENIDKMIYSGAVLGMKEKQIEIFTLAN